MGAAGPVVCTRAPHQCASSPISTLTRDAGNIFSPADTFGKIEFLQLFSVQKTCPSKQSPQRLREREAAGSGLGMVEMAPGRERCRCSDLIFPCSWRATKNSKNSSKMSAAECSLTRAGHCPTYACYGCLLKSMIIIPFFR